MGDTPTRRLQIEAAMTSVGMSGMSSAQVPTYGFLTFNVQDGMCEAILRGYRSGILQSHEYTNLGQCDQLDDVKMHLSVTDYGNILANEPSPLATTTIFEKCTEKLVEEFNFVMVNSSQPLTKFMEYITYSYMIDNVILVISGTLHDRDPDELEEKCHPMGKFPTLKSLAACANTKDLFNLVLQDTPLAPYFSETFKGEDLDELNIEIIRNTLFKAYLEDFYQFCQEIGGTTGEVMGEILRFEADRRAINITINSIGVPDMTKDDRDKLYPRMGELYPDGHMALSKCEDFEAVRSAMEKWPRYRQMFQDIGYDANRSLEDAFYMFEVELNRLAFEQQFHYGIFYSYVKLKEQEIRNIVWIPECIQQDQKGRLNQIINIF